MLLLLCSSRLDLAAGSDAVVVVALLSSASAASMLALEWVFHGLTLSGRCYRASS